MASRTNKGAILTFDQKVQRTADRKELKEKMDSLKKDFEETVTYQRTNKQTRLRPNKFKIYCYLRYFEFHFCSCFLQMVAERKRLKEKAKRDELNKYKSSTFQVVSSPSINILRFIYILFAIFVIASLY